MFAHSGWTVMHATYIVITLPYFVNRCHSLYLFCISFLVWCLFNGSVYSRAAFITLSSTGDTGNHH